MSNPFRPPGAGAPRPPEDVDPSEAIPHGLVRMAGILLVCAGALVAASGAQLFAFFTIYAAWIKVVAATMIVGGVLAFPVGGWYFGARGPWLALVLAAGLTVLSSGWVLYALSVALISGLMLVGPVTSATATLLVVVSLPYAQRAAAARRALYGG